MVVLHLWLSPNTAKTLTNNHIEGVDMGDIYEIRQQKKLVYKGSFLEKIWETPIERLARKTLKTLTKEHPQEYFELIKVSHYECCLAFTPIKEQTNDRD